MEPEHPEAPEPPPRDWPLWLLVFAVALGLRLWHAAELRARSPFWELPFTDASGYLAAGELIAAGDLQAGGGVFLQGPGYPYFLGLLLVLHGLLPEGAIGALVFIRLAQAVMGAGSCLLLALIGSRLADRPTGLVAGLLGAAYGPLLFFDLEWTPVGLLVFCLLLALLISLRIDDHEVSREQRLPWKGWLALGLLLGYASLVRMNLLPFALLLVPWGWRLMRWRRSRRRWVAVSLLLALGLAAPLGLVSARNYRVGKVTGLVYGGGINLYLGNNAEWRRTSEVRPGPEWRRIFTLPAVNPEVDPAAWNAWYVRRARQWIDENPERFREALRVRAGRLVSGHERRRNYDLYRFRRYSRVLSLLVWHPGRGLAFPFALLGPLALLGILFRLRRHWRQDLPLLLFCGVYAASLLPFFVTSRYRLPLAVVLLVFAAVALVELARRLPWGLVWLVPVFALVALASQHRQPKDPRVEAELEVILGDGAYHAGRFDAARRHYERALAHHEEHADALGRLALIARNAGQLDRAERLYDRAIARDHWSWALFFNRGRLHARRGALARAESDYREALRLRPDVAFIMVGLGEVYLRQHRAELAGQMARRALERAPGDPDAQRLLERASSRK